MTALTRGQRVRVTDPTISAAALLGREGAVVLKSIGSVAVRMDRPVPAGIRCDPSDPHLVVLWPDELTAITDAPAARGGRAA